MSRLLLLVVLLLKQTGFIFQFENAGGGFFNAGLVFLVLGQLFQVFHHFYRFGRIGNHEHVVPGIEGGENELAEIATRIVFAGDALGTANPGAQGNAPQVVGKNHHVGRHLSGHAHYFRLEYCGPAGNPDEAHAAHHGDGNVFGEI